ncbi:hypothetical protein [Haloechinothrix salitolerans]|uniref:Uncharacterized protein n=1 Tax=Haloechinothrix salitolerans TaxID=926830 RepID=A0ABW2BWP8_9PSEU
MTTSTRLVFRLAMFAIAAVTLALAFSGIAHAAPGGDDTVSPTPHTHQPFYTPPPGWEPAAPEGEPEAPSEPPADPEPDPETEEPTEPTEPAPTKSPAPQPEEPTLVQPTAAPQPTSAPESQPFATPAATTSSTPADDVPAASQPANAGAVRVAIGAGLAAVLLGGGWLATSLARMMRQERHS